jgi:signal transduction histidine kinase
MTASRLSRAVFALMVAAALGGMLAFLFLQTQAGGISSGAAAMRVLRELREVDLRWNAEAVALRDSEVAVATPAPMQVDRLLRELRRVSTGVPTIVDLAALEASAREKQAAFDALHAAHKRNILARNPEWMRLEANAADRFRFQTFGERVELTSRTIAHEIETALDDTARWRVYLAAYAAALLLGVAALALRVLQAQAALRTANESLERRVAERTQELTSALQQLRESEAQLVQSEKMSSLGQLVAGVAHEINTPLAYVKNGVTNVRDRLPEITALVVDTEQLLGLLREDHPEEGALQQAFSAVSGRLAELRGREVLPDIETLTRDGLHGIEQIAELVSNLRNFARLDRSRVASYNVNEGVRGAFLIARPMLRKVDVEQRLGDVPLITCSPSQVNQVVLNLVTNAVQAIDKPRGNIVAVTRGDGTGNVVIEVGDNGRGIAADILPRIFDPFFTTKDVGQGTGLGLSIAYKIVKQHGGRIDVRTRPGEGTTFIVTLPIVPPPVLAEAEATAEAAA